MPTDSDQTTIKGTPKNSPPDSPESFLAALPPVMLPPRGIKRHQAKSEIADYANTSAELLDLLAASPPNSAALPQRNGHPNPLRAHALFTASAQTGVNGVKMGDEPGSPPPPGPRGPAMVDKDFSQEVSGRKGSSGSKTSLRRIFSRSPETKRSFKGMDKDGLWVTGY